MALFVLVLLLVRAMRLCRHLAIVLSLIPFYYFHAKIIVWFLILLFFSFLFFFSFFFLFFFFFPPVSPFLSLRPFSLSPVRSRRAVNLKYSAINLKSSRRRSSTPVRAVVSCPLSAQPPQVLPLLQPAKLVAAALFWSGPRLGERKRPSLGEMFAGRAEGQEKKTEEQEKII